MKTAAPTSRADSMSRSLHLVVVLLCIIPELALAGIPQRRLLDVLNSPHKRISQLLNGGTNDDDIVSAALEALDVEENYIQQRLDHFAPAEGRHFQQRYFSSKRFVVAKDQEPAVEMTTTSDERATATVRTSRKQQQQQKQHLRKSTSPQPPLAFLCVGGEGPALDKSVLVDSVHCTGDMLELAQLLHKEHGMSVFLFALEHRYYGKSYPEFYDAKNQTEPALTNKNLKYLSSRQALSDLAHFATTRDLPLSTRWVTFGGSYPGMLAAWARLKFPHIIHSAVSNSAPIQARVDMYMYNNRVGFDLQYERIGGTKECLNTFAKGHQQLAEGVEKNDATMRDTIAKQFNLCDASSLEDPRNLGMFLGDGVVGVYAQGNDPACKDPLCNIERLCSFVHTQAEDPATSSWEILANVSRQQNGDDQCTELDWNKTLEVLASPTKSKFGGTRSWLWQTCTEFGFYQTCKEDSRCPYGKGYHLVDSDLEICSYAYGISKDEVYESVRQTLEYYGDHMELKGGSRILSVNGVADPWSTLARTRVAFVDDNGQFVSKDEENSLPVYKVEGASHHYWTHQVKATDDKDIRDAREFIYQTVMGWLDIAGGDSDEDASPPSSGVSYLE